MAFDAVDAVAPAFGFVVEYGENARLRAYNCFGTSSIE